MYSYDRRTAAQSDTEDVFSAFYTQKAPARDALDALVKAFRPPVDLFLKRLEAEIEAGRKMAGRPMVVQEQELHALIVKYLLSNYGMERSLAKGLADQIVKGQNY